MTQKRIANQHHATFEGIRQLDEAGQEFWLARQLAEVLDYSQYRHFLPVVERAKEACLNSGQPVENHIEDVLTMVEIGSGAQREIADIRLSRYGVLGAKDIHAHKGLKKSQKILDHMGSTELAANLFRATQTEEKLKRENVQGKRQANKAHYEVGEKVRATIKELGGTMPEALPTPAQSIKQVESAKKKLDGKK